MILNTIQLCRAAALLDGLRVLNANKVPDELTSEGLEGLQRYTLERSTEYAEQYGVDFPDDTIPESLIASLGLRHVGRPTAEELAAIQAAMATQTFSRAFVETNEIEEDWAVELEAQAEREAYREAA